MKMKIKLTPDQEDKVVVDILKHHYGLVKIDESTNPEDQIAQENHLWALEILLRYFMVEARAVKWIEKQWNDE